MRIGFIVAAVLMVPIAAGAQQNQPPTIASEAGSRLATAEREVLQVADAMPEDRYSFAPTTGEFKGVRTFAQQLRHIGAYNYILCSGIKQEKPPDTNGDEGPANITSKAAIQQYLRESFAYCRQAFDMITPQNMLQRITGSNGAQTTRLALATFADAHPFDHYGQLVVYLRMNGRVPPASLPRPPASR
jgi:uncharacterized damage-inducible protein DinB